MTEDTEGGLGTVGSEKCPCCGTMLHPEDATLVRDALILAAREGWTPAQVREWLAKEGYPKHTVPFADDHVCGGGVAILPARCECGREVERDCDECGQSFCDGCWRMHDEEECLSMTSILLSDGTRLRMDSSRAMYHETGHACALDYWDCNCDGADGCYIHLKADTTVCEKCGVSLLDENGDEDAGVPDSRVSEVLAMLGLTEVRED